MLGFDHGRYDCVEYYISVKEGHRSRSLSLLCRNAVAKLVVEILAELLQDGSTDIRKLHFSGVRLLESTYKTAMAITIKLNMPLRPR